MDFRFNKSTSVIQGFYLYLGKDGLSTTIGPRGAYLTIGKDGATFNTSIPKKEPSTTMTASGEQELKIIEGLAGLKEYLEESRNYRETLSIEIMEAEKNCILAQRAFDKTQNGFLSKLFTKKETEESRETELEEITAYLANLKKQYEESQAAISIQLEEGLEDQYQKLSAAFAQLTTSNKIWDITSQVANTDLKSSAKNAVNRQEVRFGTEHIDFIKSSFPAFHFQNANGSQLYIYPAFVITIDAAKSIAVLDIREFNFSFSSTRFLESKQSIPTDTKIIDQTWDKVNKNGTPDMRYAGNYQIPIVKYAEYEFKADNGLSERYQISNFEFAETFANEFLTYCSLVQNPATFNVTASNSGAVVTAEEFEKIKSFADKHIALISKLEIDEAFRELIYRSPQIKGLNIDDIKDLLHLFFVLDLMKCFSMTADITNLKSKEAFALLYTISKKKGLKIDTYAQHKRLYYGSLISDYETIYKDSKTAIEAQSDNALLFRLPVLFAAYDKDIASQYLSNLYRFASIVVKIDGTVTKAEEEVLKTIMSLPANLEVKSQPKETPKTEETPKPKSAIPAPLIQKTVDAALEELNSLTGLTAVKEEIKSLINFIKVQKAREEKGFKSSSLSYHIVFTGNPGTGKTTVARIVAQIYKSLGVLQQGQLVETDRSGLIAEYVGQTAVKVNKTVDSALNGVLFIDEAYSIVGDAQDSFGKEAVSTLIKRMEDDRDKLIVILAGYTKEMQGFIETNPGFKSRFNRYIDFTDYQPEELISIYEGLCKKLDYKLNEEAKTKLTVVFTNAYNNRDKSFGNGRFVRNTFEKSMERQANRIASIADLTDEVLTTITADDIPDK